MCTQVWINPDQSYFSYGIYEILDTFCLFFNSYRIHHRGIMENCKTLCCDLLVVTCAACLRALYLCAVVGMGSRNKKWQTLLNIFFNPIEKQVGILNKVQSGRFIILILILNEEFFK